MFSKDITASDAFLDMPASSQALYFHLGMEADDDGFIGNPKKVMRVLGVSTDDMKILLTKRFVLDFPSGVVVVKHHRINNNWDKYNCKRTMYLEEFSQLNIKENKAYTLDKTQGTPIQTENSLQTVSRIEENRIEYRTPIVVQEVKETEKEKKPSEAKYPHAFEVFGWFPNPQESWKSLKNTQEREYAEYLYARGEEKVKKALRYIASREDDENFKFVVVKPSDLEKKWEDIKLYAKRNN